MDDSPLHRTTARISVGLRVAFLAVTLALAPLTVIPPVSWRHAGPALAILAGWTAGYSAVAHRHGLLVWLVLVDVALTAAACLVVGQLVPLRQLSGGSSWVGVMVTVCVMGIGLAWPAWASVPTGLAVAAAYVAGSRLAGVPEVGAGQGFVAAVQVVAIAGVMALVRRSRTAADAAFDAAQDAGLMASVERARREDERDELVVLHDTALATLTMVGTGTITAESPWLRERAARDLAALEGFTAARQTGEVRLDRRIEQVAAEATAAVTVTVQANPCRVPGPVADAFAGGVQEALANVVRHSGADRATVAVRAVDGRVTVRVTDRGRGFDPDDVPAHRYGVRDSIAARMRRVGGAARVTSTPGQGTQWTMEWTGVD
jgi:signal transduction histidine kinase